MARRGQRWSGNTEQKRRRESWTALSFSLAAVLLLIVPREAGQAVTSILRATILRPFIAIQGSSDEAAVRIGDVRALRTSRDSMLVRISALQGLEEENARLRGLLGLSRRAGAGFVAASVEHGAGARRGVLLLDRGAVDGVQAGSVLLAASGLVGIVGSTVDAHRAVAIDWTHPDFRVSAMTASGAVYGIVMPRGSLGERLILTGTSFSSDLKEGTLIVTAGEGGIVPRGIPIGWVDGVEDAESGWRKTYLLRPAAVPASIRQVLVATSLPGPLGPIWAVPLADSTQPAGGKP